MTRKKSIIISPRPMDQNTDTRLMMGLCLSQTPQYMVTYGRTISTTGCCTPSTLRRDPRPELRGQDQDPRPGGGRHQPGEDGRPRDREGGSEGAALQHYRDSSRCLVHNVALSTISCLCSMSSVQYTHPTPKHAVALLPFTVVHRFRDQPAPPAFQTSIHIQNESH